jgi:hypothetical protein
MKLFLRFDVLAALLMAQTCLAEADNLPLGARITQMVGDDLDDNGCKASAGFTWCEALKICIRPFETECPLFSSATSQLQAAKVTAAKVSKAPKTSKAPKVSKAPKTSKAPQSVQSSQGVQSPQSVQSSQGVQSTQGVQSSQSVQST